MCLRSDKLKKIMQSKILALDIGSARIGIAISDSLGMLAHPLKTVLWKSKELLKNEIEQILQSENISLILIGLPLTLKGKYSQQTIKVLDLIEYLKDVLTVNIETIDERLTTKMAERMLHDVGKKASKNRQIIDQIAAVNILQTYLDKKN